MSVRGSDFIGRTNQRLETGILQYVPGNIKQSQNTRTKRLAQMAQDSTIAQLVLDNPECAYEYRDSWFSNSGEARTAKLLHMLKAAYIQLHRSHSLLGGGWPVRVYFPF